ncbi:hypothetical protein LCGC14_3040400, partial [marine sediment metagenome]
IGSSMNCFIRTYSHSKNFDFNSITTIGCEKDRRVAIEFLYINKYKPKYNKVYRPRNLPKLEHSQCLEEAKFPEELHCKQCNYKWIPRKIEVKQCPQCKRYDWENNKK